MLGRVVLDGKAIHVADVQADQQYALVEQRALGEYRTVLGVPLMREGTPIGVIVLTRNAVRPFTDKQIELVTTFADQAVIAIENARLFEAEQERTAELTEALEQQTATSEVLGVISRRPASWSLSLRPCWKTLPEFAMRALEFSGYAKGRFPLATLHNAPPVFAEEFEEQPVVLPLRAAAFAILPTRGGSLTSPTWRRCRLTLKAGTQSLLPWN